MRRRITAGNWKMYKTAPETVQFLAKFKQLANGVSGCEVVIFPPSLSIPAAVTETEGTPIHVGGQNIYWCSEGAYTGEVSADMMRAAGATWVLVGHSERRHQVCHESDADVLKKAQAALAANLTPIVCIGEKLEEHKAGKAHEVLVKQFACGVAGLTEEQFAQIVLAYEPVWAIGTGQTATPEIASEAHKLIRSEAGKRFGVEAAEQVRILYGGSVRPDNIKGLMREPEIDGTLVGGASLDPDTFIQIVKAA
ncbi:MAG: triose-phosphate isomerase [Acidobacteriaceae bacterium]|nr:triose-phosphate isomerase [Acidobacteriaceae bacterium]